MSDRPFTPNNYAFVRTAEALYPMGPEAYGPRMRRGRPTAQTGAIPQENGDILFRIWAPDAHEVLVNLEGLTVHYGSRVNILELERTGQDFPEELLSLEKNDKGFFEGILAKDKLEGFYGAFPFWWVIDGAPVIHPYCRTTWRSGRLMNCVEVADPDLQAEFEMRDVPHGTVCYEMFYSEIRGDWSPCLVYIPAEYHTNTGKRYPVMYLQHGGGENETGWVTLANLPEVMDNLIAAGKAEPMIIVMNNTRIPNPTAANHGDHPGLVTFGAVDDLITRECIPFIEGRYRCLEGKENRAIAGLSQGGMQTSYVGFSHPELFGYVGIFSASIRTRHFWEDYNENPHLGMFTGDIKQLEENYRVIYRGVGAQERESRPWHKEDDRFIHERGIDQLKCYHHTIHPTMCHEWGVFRRSLYEFAQLIFK